MTIKEKFDKFLNDEHEKFVNMTSSEKMIHRYKEIQNEIFNEYKPDDSGVIYSNNIFKIFMIKMKIFNNEYFYGILDLDLIKDVGMGVVTNRETFPSTYKLTEFEIYFKDGRDFRSWSGNKFDDYLLERYELPSIKNKIERIYDNT